MLRLPQLLREEFLGGLATRVQGTLCRPRFALEDLRDDRMAPGLRDGSGGSHQRHGQAAEPVDVEPDVDCAEGGGRRAERTAGVRRADAPGVHTTSRSRGERVALDSGRDLHQAGGRVLRLSEYFVFSW